MLHKKIVFFIFFIVIAARAMDDIDINDKEREIIIEALSNPSYPRDNITTKTDVDNFIDNILNHGWKHPFRIDAEKLKNVPETINNMPLITYMLNGIYMSDTYAKAHTYDAYQISRRIIQAIDALPPSRIQKTYVESLRMTTNKIYATTGFLPIMFFEALYELAHVRN